jgi:UDP-glucuronate decarboxylase
MTASIITGGAGFLGSHLAAALVARGETVVIIDNLSTGRLDNLRSPMNTERAIFVHADVATDPAILRIVVSETGCEQIATVYHLASPASPEAYGAHPWETLTVNGLGTMSLIELALGHGARFVFASTSEVYGDPLVHPQSENYFGNVNPIGPRSCYDEGKRFGEAAVAAAVRTRGLDARIVRFFNCYGPRMGYDDGRLIPSLFAAVSNGTPMPLHGDGHQTRSLTYVSDAIDLLLRVTSSHLGGLHVVNVGSDDERSVEEIARTVAEVAGVPYVAEYTASRPEDPRRRRPDLSRARALGWEPKTSLLSGLRSTYGWYRSLRAACS